MLKPYPNCYIVEKYGEKTKIKGKTISVEKLKNLKDVTELLLAQMAIQRKKQLSNYSETPRPKRPPPQDCYSTLHTPNSCRHNCCQHVVCCPSCRNWMLHDLLIFMSYTFQRQSLNKYFSRSMVLIRPPHRSNKMTILSAIWLSFIIKYCQKV